jgi:hypothetical protein
MRMLTYIYTYVQEPMAVYFDPSLGQRIPRAKCYYCINKEVNANQVCMCILCF